MFFVTLFALFGDDIKFITTTNSADYGFFVADMICVAFFLFEAIVLSWTKTTVLSWYPLRFQGYMKSANFFLDIVVILSLFLPVYFNASLFSKSDLRSGIIVRTVRWYGKSALLYRNFYEFLSRFSRDESGAISNPSANTNTANQSSHASSLTPSKHQSSSYHKKSTFHAAAAAAASSIPALKDVHYTSLEVKPNDSGSGSSSLMGGKKSKLGSQLTDAITVKVVLITLVMLLILPLTFYYIDDHGRYNYTLWLHSMLSSPQVSEVSKQSFYNQYIIDMQYQPSFYDVDLHKNQAFYLLQLLVHPENVPPYQVDPSYIAGLRSEAVTSFSFTSTVNGQVYSTSALFSLNSAMRTVAFFNIILTAIVCCLLVAGATIITHDVQRLVLSPIEVRTSVIICIVCTIILYYIYMYLCTAHGIFSGASE